METHPHDHVLVQEDPAKISQLLVDIDSHSDIFYIAEFFFYIELYIFRLFYIWMPLWVSIITFEPLLVPYIPHLQQV